MAPQIGYRNFAYTGWLVKKELSERLELGAELFAHGPEGIATPQIQSSAMVDVGGYYHFKNHPGRQFLFCYGHSIAGQTENYAYIGLYWTWGGGKDNKKGEKTDLSFQDRSRASLSIEVDLIEERVLGRPPACQLFRRLLAGRWTRVTRGSVWSSQKPSSILEVADKPARAALDCS